MRNAFISFCALINMNVVAQSPFWSENFDQVTAPSLPAGWTIAMDAGSTGWRVDSTNSSGYAGASAGNNVVIRNDENVSGDYTLLSPNINASGYGELSVKFGSRVSNNFLVSGSTPPLFSFSIDGGLSWNELPFEDNDANSLWGWVNLDQSILLPSMATNQPLLRFKWVIHIEGDGATTSGTYRIDDFVVYANDGIGLEEQGSNITPFPNPFNDELTVSVASGFSNIVIYDQLGKTKDVHWRKNANVWTVDSHDWISGVYFLEVEQNGSRKRMKVIHL